MATLETFLKEKHTLTTADIPTLASVLVGSFLFWAFVYLLNHMYMHKIKKDCKEFHQLKDGDQALYLSRIPAALHALLAFVLASVVIFGTW